MILKRCGRCLLVFLAAILVLVMALPVDTVGEVYAGSGPPVDVVRRTMLDRAPAKYEEEYRQLVEMLNELPAEIPVGEKAVVTRRMSNVTVMLTVYHNEHEGKANGWDFYWHKYWRQGDFEARMPNTIALCLNEKGEVAFFYSSLWFNVIQVKGDVKVTRNEALEKALEIVRHDMEWIGVTGINWTDIVGVLENEENTWPRSSVYYPCWCVEVRYDRLYVRPDGGRWIIGYVVCIRADTGEILYHHEQGVYAPVSPPEGYKHEEIQSDDILLNEDPSAAEAQPPIWLMSIAIALVIISPLAAVYRRRLLRKLHLQH